MSQLLPDVLLFHPVNKRKAPCVPDNAELKQLIFGVDKMEEEGLSAYRGFPVPEDFPWSLGEATIQEVLSDYLNQDFVGIIEVGSHIGTTATRFGHLIKDNPRSFIMCIDTWLSGTDDYLLRTESVKLNLLPGNECVLFRTFLANVLKNGLEKTVIPFRMPSVHAGRILFFHGVQVDVVYVDASHEYIDVKHDLELFYRVVKGGGVLFGDDYQIPGVKKAVDEFFGDMGVQVEFKSGVLFNNIRQNIWLVRKPQP